MAKPLTFKAVMNSCARAILIRDESWNTKKLTVKESVEMAISEVVHKQRLSLTARELLIWTEFATFMVLDHPIRAEETSLALDGAIDVEKMQNRLRYRG